MIKIRLIILWKSVLVHEMNVEELLAVEAGSFFVCVCLVKKTCILFTHSLQEKYIFYPLL
nr:MAG TPA: hypothetical protein [Caudoviricetes sp.]